MTAAGPPANAVTVIGEALIDLVPAGAPASFRAHPGGSPYNVAVGLARLGAGTNLMARLADNAFGRILRRSAAAERIRLDAAPLASEPTTLAVVSLDAQARASYDFYTEGTSDWQWTAEETAAVPGGTAVLHFGSIASWTGPGDELILGLASRLRDRGDVLVSYDPNIRPPLLRERGHGRRMVERAVAIAHLVKASEEDVAWLYPGWPAADVARHWLGLGTTVVLITHGASGADLYAPPAPALHRPAPSISVVDTVGAGDAFTAGLLASLLRRGMHPPAALRRAAEQDLDSVLADAILTAALACQRAGACPPTLAEFQAAARRGQQAGER